MSELSTAGWNNCIFLLDPGPIIVIEENVIPCPLNDRSIYWVLFLDLINARATINMVGTGPTYYNNNPKLNYWSS